MAPVREPAVAGTFYDGSATALRRSIEALFLGRPDLGVRRAERAARREWPGRSIVALVAPHAGYRFSGYAAAAAFLELAEDGIPDVAVIIGPNHHGLGAPAAAGVDGLWRTPLGDVEVDAEVARAIVSGSRYLEADDAAHRMEHSVEVQLPFLQRIGDGNTKIVPIVISGLSRWDSRLLVQDLGHAIASALAGKNAVVIASTDFTHYEPQASAEAKDKLAIAAIQELDPEKLLRTVESNNITICGAVPTAITIAAAKELGATAAELISYYTSGDILGKPTQVVGYASLKIMR